MDVAVRLPLSPWPQTTWGARICARYIVGEDLSSPKTWLVPTPGQRKRTWRLCAVLTGKPSHVHCLTGTANQGASLAPDRLPNTIDWLHSALKDTSCASRFDPDNRIWSSWCLEFFFSSKSLEKRSRSVFGTGCRSFLSSFCKHSIPSLLSRCLCF